LGNKENVIPPTQQIQTEMRKKGKHKKRGQTLREAARNLLSAPLPEDDPLKEALAARGVKRPTGADAVMAAQYFKAAQPFRGIPDLIRHQHQL